MAYSGKFIPKNPHKYLGNPTNIVYRSLWERTVMVRFDEDDQIISWGSEELIILYEDPQTRKIRRYFPDFVVKMRQRDGNIAVMIVEVKPDSQCKPPKQKKKVTKKYLNEVVTYATNQAKWKAATEFANKRGWKFIVLTENDIFNKNK